MTLWLGPDDSAVTMEKCDSLNADWLKCYADTEGSEAWDDVYFVKPEILDTAGECA